ncbi:unnamed protein product [Cuscuta campestris]|uniref:Peptidase M48 domain-containing protein n=2 Tax=Cuscuta sect. Cleistogrammica TaxID=1824901 RepID=A0A484L9C5_9ASTE|nr:hypothetical protein DM860_010886 [Cuscuta australis]VFQ72738.1 unnamed protein product [Cuscuta campestris]
MGWYRRSRFVLDAVLSSAERISSKNQVSESISRTKFGSGSSLFVSPVSRNPISQSLFHPNHYKPQFLSQPRRWYYVDRRQVRHFRPRGPDKWFQNPRNLFIVLAVGSGVVISVYIGNLETIPYTKRTHFVLLSRTLEKELGEKQFKELKASFKDKILPAIHPESVRVQLIANDVIGALQRGLRKEQGWGDLRYTSMVGVEGSHVTAKEQQQQKLMAPSSSSSSSSSSSDKWEDEVLDDKWIEKSRKEGKENGKEAYTGHLEGLNWEVLVVNDPMVNAFCLPGGKIVVFTGLFKHFKSDAELAAIIGHEVGHAVARHSAEEISKRLWIAIIQLVLYQFVVPDVVNTMSTLFLNLPFTRRMEMEADYIGLLLMASAGYDPREAPKVYEKLGKIGGQSALQDYLSTHPSGKKRAQLLSRAEVMEEALSIYRDVQAGRGVEGFL